MRFSDWTFLHSCPPPHCSWQPEATSLTAARPTCETGVSAAAFAAAAFAAAAFAAAAFAAAAFAAAAFAAAASAAAASAAAASGRLDWVIETAQMLFSGSQP